MQRCCGLCPSIVVIVHCSSKLIDTPLLDLWSMSVCIGSGNLQCICIMSLSQHNNVWPGLEIQWSLQQANHCQLPTCPAQNLYGLGQAGIWSFHMTTNMPDTAPLSSTCIGHSLPCGSMGSPLFISTSFTIILCWPKDNFAMDALEKRQNCCKGWLGPLIVYVPGSIFKYLHCNTWAAHMPSCSTLVSLWIPLPSHSWLLLLAQSRCTHVGMKLANEHTVIAHVWRKKSGNWSLTVKILLVTAFNGSVGHAWTTIITSLPHTFEVRWSYMWCYI